MTTTLRDVSGQADVTKRSYEGGYKRPPTQFHNTITPDGPYQPAEGRYVLYVSYACPWAHRTLIARKLKGLESIVQTIVVSPKMGSNGWAFGNVDPFPKAEEDTVNHANHMKDLYLSVNPDYTGRFTVPVLWDKETSSIVNNESSEILKILNSGFNSLLPPQFAEVDLYPKDLQTEIDEWNDLMYENVNNGVYKTGASNKQEAYETLVQTLFETLDKFEAKVSGQRYLIGNRLTEADIRLYVTLVRFDVAYHGLAKCNLYRIRDHYPGLHLWMRRLYWKNDAFNSTTDFDHIKTHYYWSLAHINPTRIVPVGPIPHIEELNEQ